ncbi:unnamed protein product [Ectocarpus sp. 12 AP-2014]
MPRQGVRPDIHTYSAASEKNRPVHLFLFGRGFLSSLSKDVHPTRRGQGCNNQASETAEPSRSRHPCFAFGWARVSRERKNKFRRICEAQLEAGAQTQSFFPFAGLGQTSTSRFRPKPDLISTFPRVEPSPCRILCQTKT